MKKRIAIMLCLAFVCCAGGCEKETAQSTASSTETEVQEEEAVTMKLYINDTEVPVVWENNAAVEALAAEAGKGDIVVNMSMYGGNEQFGPLGKSYPASNRQVTTSNGDIVLFNNDQIVEGISAGVANANDGVIAAIYALMNLIDDKDLSVSIGDDVIGRSYDRYNRNRGVRVNSGAFSNAY